MSDDVRLERYIGSWPADDPDANLKAEVAELTRVDPLPALRNLAEATGIPLGALVRYVLVRWASEGSEALLALGPPTVERLWRHVAAAEAAGTDAARLEAYDALRQMLAWLRSPLEHDGDDGDEGRDEGGA
ncbi:MAG: DUF6027 family protein [Egibacteraceae bacterium]